MIKALFFWLWVMAGVLAWGSAHAAQTWRLGVLSFQTKAETRAQWAATAQLLSDAVHPDQVELVPLSYAELNAAVEARQVDLVFTNPEHYVVLRNGHGLYPMATLSARIDGQVVNLFGSVVFTRSQSDIMTFQDLRGKRLAAVNRASLGGFLMAADALREAGVDIVHENDVRLILTDVPHANTVRAVLLGQADAGIARTGVLEQLAAKGQVNLTDLRVLNAQTAAHFPQQLSTALYPEWPMAAMSHVPVTVVKAWTVALLTVDAQADAARLGHYAGFTPPANYAPVEELMRRLRVYPGMAPESVFKTLWIEHSSVILVLGVLLAGSVVMVAAVLWRSNRRLRAANDEESRLRESMELDAAAFYSEVGLFVADADTRIRRANPALEAMLGYASGELEGQTTQVLRGVSESKGRLQELLGVLSREGRWHGELRCRMRTGDDLPCMVTIRATHLPDGKVSGYVASFADISEQKHAEEVARELAFYDPLTRLPNRRMFLERLQEAMDDAQASGLLAGIMFIDLDHFKNLNDTHGHAVGDQLLRRIAQRLQLLIGAQDLAARLGGDEFVVVLPRLDTSEEAAMRKTMAVAQAVHDALLEPYELEAVSDVTEAALTLRYTCGGSIGVALFGLLPESLTEVLKRADVAMYRSKQDGRNLIRPYDPQVQQLLKARVALSNELNQALADDRLQLLYQPQVDADGVALGAECLLRWHHPVRGVVSPAEFIPLAEDSGAIVAMGDWVLRTACHTLVAWAVQPALAELGLSVNVSPRQFLEPTFVDKLAAILNETGASPARLRLEVTEGIVMQDTPQVVARMRALCDMGLSFSIDDFGTGYSSMSYLQMLPLAEIKIDKAFVNDVTHNERSAAIVRAIIALGRSMDVTIVSEGVETVEQARYLLDQGSTLIQGYLYSRPLTREAFEAWHAQRVTATASASTTC